MGLFPSQLYCTAPLCSFQHCLLSFPQPQSASLCLWESQTATKGLWEHSLCQKHKHCDVLILTAPSPQSGSYYTACAFPLDCARWADSDSGYCLGVLCVNILLCNGRVLCPVTNLFNYSNPTFSLFPSRPRLSRPLPLSPPNICHPAWFNQI